MNTFKDGIGLQDLLLYPGVFSTDGCKVLQYQLCALRFPSSRLSTNHNALVLPVNITLYNSLCYAYCSDRITLSSS